MIHASHVRQVKMGFMIAGLAGPGSCLLSLGIVGGRGRRGWMVVVLGLETCRCWKQKVGTQTEWGWW